MNSIVSYLSPSQAATSFKDQFLPNLSSNQKIAAVALAIFSLGGLLCYALYRYMQEQRNINQRLAVPVQPMAESTQQAAEGANLVQRPAPTQEVQVHPVAAAQAQETIKVFAKTIFGLKVEYDVLPQDTIRSYKEKIAESLGSRIEDIQLFFRGTKLSDDNFLRDYGISNRSTLRIVQKIDMDEPASDIPPVQTAPQVQPQSEPEKIQVSTKVVSGGSFSHQVSPQMTIHSFKELITSDGNLIPDMIKLIFAGRRLEDNKTLADYRIVNGSTIHVIIPQCLKRCDDTESETETIKVFVETLDGQKLNFDVSPQTTIHSYKEIICERIGMYPSQFNLKYANTEMQEDKTLQDYRIFSHTTIFVVLKPLASTESGTIKVFVKTLDDQTIDFDIPPQVTVHSYKEIIGEKIGMTNDQFSLVFANMRLQENRTLEDYQISNEATILVVRNGSN